MNPTWRILWDTPELWWVLFSPSVCTLILCVCCSSNWMLLSSLLQITSHIMDLWFHGYHSECAGSLPLSPSFSSQLITEPFFIITATMSEGWEASTSLSPSFICVRLITDYYCGWQSAVLLFSAPDPKRLWVFVVFCLAYTALSIGYPKTLSGLQSRHNCHCHWSDRRTACWELDKLIPRPKPPISISLGGRRVCVQHVKVCLG